MSEISLESNGPDTTTVLYVDPDAEYRASVAETLEAGCDGVTVRGEATAAGALDRIDTERIGCLVTEQDLPDATGLELLDAARDRQPHLPVVLFTASGSDAIASDAIGAGVTDYVPKGPDTSTLTLSADRVCDAIEQYRTRRQSVELARINSVIRDVNTALVRASTRAEIETRVCRIFAHSDPYVFAWIGEHDPDTGEIEPRALSGIEEGYLDEIHITADHAPTGRGPTGTATRTGEIAVVQNVLEDPAYEPWREAALARDFQSTAAVPLRSKDATFGTLNLYADRPYAFDGDERAVLVELGESIAAAVAAAEQHRALRSFRKAIEYAGHAVYVTDADGVIEYANPKLEEITGYDRDELLGETPRVFRSGEHSEQFYEKIWKTIRAGDVWEGELVNEHESGERYVVEQTIAPVRAEDGEVVRYVAVSRDVTDRKRRERRLREYESALENIEDLIAVFDDEARFVFANRAYRAFHAADTDDLSGEPPSAVLSEESVESIEPYVERALGGETAQYQMARSPPDGPERIFDVRYYPIESDEGEVRRVVSILRDVTDQIEKDRQLNLVDRVLRHDVKNEMNVILGQAEQIRETGSDELRERAEAISETGNELVDLVDKERMILKLDTEESTFSTVDVGDVLRQAVARAGASGPDADITLEAPSGVEVTTLPEIELALTELIENAIVHNDNTRPEVAIAVEEREETVSISIADDGPGIRQEERAVLTDDEPIHPLQHGSGLGLWFVYWTINRAGGHLAIEPNDPRGSVVQVELPRNLPNTGTGPLKSTESPESDATRNPR